MKHFNKSPLVVVFLVLLLFTNTIVVMANPPATPGNFQEPTDPVSFFSDVPDNYSNALFINYLANRGLIKGFSDGTFRPDTGLTRAEAAALLIRVAKLTTPPSTTPFTDVKSDHWAKANIGAVAAAGLMGGYPDGTFRPNAMLTRAEGISLFLRLAPQQNPGLTLPTLADLGPDHWAASSVAVGLAAGMMGLSQDQKHFLPGAPLTRGDMARIMGIILTQEPHYYQEDLQGQVKVNKGSISLTKATGQTINPKDTANISQGDSIKTSAGSEAEITFPDGSGLLLLENTVLSIKEARGRSYITNRGTAGIAVDWLALDLKQGNIFGALATKYEVSQTNNNQVTTEGGYLRLAALDENWVKQMLASTNKSRTHLLADNTQQNLPWYQQTQTKKVKVKVDMPWSVCAIRGTFWNNQVAANGSSITNLLQGEGQVTAGGNTVGLSGGQSTSVPGPSVPPTPPAPLSATQSQQWVSQAPWVVARAQAIDANREHQAPPPPTVGQPQQMPTQQPVVPPPPQPQQQLQPPATLSTMLNALVQANNGQMLGNIPQSLQQVGEASPPSPVGGGGGSGGNEGGSNNPPHVTLSGTIDGTELLNNTVSVSALKYVPVLMTITATVNGEKNTAADLILDFGANAGVVSVKVGGVPITSTNGKFTIAKVALNRTSTTYNNISLTFYNSGAFTVNIYVEDT